MRPLLYLVRISAKNRLLELRKKPSRIIYIVILLALLVFVLASASRMEMPMTARNVNELTAIAAAFYTMMFIMTASAGFSRGGNLFTLSDSVLLFTAPIRSQTILFYGLLRQMGLSLVMGFFLLFQYATLRSAYGISVAQMLGLLVWYGVAIFVGQVTAMVLYALFCHDEKQKKAARFVFCGFFALCAAYVLGKALLGGSLDGVLSRVVETVSGGFLYALPIGGWLGLAAKGILNGGAGLVLQGAGLCAALLAALLFLLFRTDQDYYEDVLKSAELSYSAIAAKKEGTMQEATPANVKVGKTGLRGGWGASALLRKHLLENRRSKKLLLPSNSLMFACITFVFCAFMRDAGVVPAFVMATYLQLFTALMTGRFNYELLRPYIYLIPEPPLKKLLWALAETAPAALLDALVVFVPVGLILALPPVELVLVIVARLSFSAVYLAADIAVERIWGGSVSKVLVMLLYMALALAIMAPGVILAVVTAIGSSSPAAFAAMSLVNFAMSLLVCFLCRNLLQHVELSGQ